MSALEQVFLLKRGTPTGAETVDFIRSRRQELEGTRETWGPNAFAYLERGQTIYEITIEMEVRTVEQHGGPIRLPPYERERFFGALAEFEMLRMASGVAPAYSRPPTRLIRLPSRLGDHLAMLTWQAAMRFHAHVLAFVPPEIREARLARLELPPERSRERLPRLLERLPATLAAKYRELLERPPPSERDVEAAVREACEQARSG